FPVVPFRPKQLRNCSKPLSRLANRHAQTAPLRLPRLQQIRSETACAFLSTINPQPSTLRGSTSPYRHGPLPCVHQVEPAPPRLSSIPKGLRPDVGSSGLLFPFRLQRPA